MSAAPIPWSEKEQDLLRKYAAESLSAQAIANSLFKETGQLRSRSAVIGYAYRHGISLLFTSLDGAKLSNARQKAAKTVVEKKKETSLSPTVKKEKPTAAAIKLNEDLFVPLKKLNSRTCRFPVKNVTSHSYLFCGALPNGKSPYCPDHANLCFQPKSKK
jgi:hypothetical protein